MDGRGGAASTPAAGPRVGPHELPAALEEARASLAQQAEPAVIAHDAAGEAIWLALRPVTLFDLATVRAATTDWCWRARGKLAGDLKLATVFHRDGRRFLGHGAWLNMDRAVIVGFIGPEERDQVIALEYARPHAPPAVRVSRPAPGWAGYERWHTLADGVDRFLAALLDPATALERCWPALETAERCLLAALVGDDDAPPAGAAPRGRFRRIAAQRGLHEADLDRAYERALARLVRRGLLRPVLRPEADRPRHALPWQATLRALVAAWAGSPTPRHTVSPLRLVSTRNQPGTGS